MRPHQGSVEGKENLPRPAGHTLLDATALFPTALARDDHSRVKICPCCADLSCSRPHTRSRLPESVEPTGARPHALALRLCTVHPIQLPWEGLHRGSAVLLLFGVASAGTNSFLYLYAGSEEAARRPCGTRQHISRVLAVTVQVGLPRGKGVLQPGAEGG